MKFTREFLENILETDSAIVEDKIIQHKRWSIVHQLIFKVGNQFFRTTYQVGATESQAERPWEYEDEIDCVEVKPVEKMMTVWELVN